MDARRTRQVRHRRRFARLSLPGNTSAGSRSCRHPPRGTKTSGLSSRLSRTPAQTLPPARTLLPPVSASPSPGRPTRSLPPPDVDSHAPAAFLGYFARPPRALHVASSQCQEVTASTAAGWLSSGMRFEYRPFTATSVLAAAMAHFLDALGIESTHIIGAKVGGAIAVNPLNHPALSIPCRGR